VLIEQVWPGCQPIVRTGTVATRGGFYGDFYRAAHHAGAMLPLGVLLDHASN